MDPKAYYIFSINMYVYNIYIYIYVCLCTCTCLCLCLCICKCTCVYVCMCWLMFEPERFASKPAVPSSLPSWRMVVFHCVPQTHRDSSELQVPTKSGNGKFNSSGPATSRTKTPKQILVASWGFTGTFLGF